MFIWLLNSNFLYSKTRHLKFEHLTTEHGLSQSTITCILQDQQGYMWFGTQDGLNCYDGYTFTIYQHNPGDSNSISSNTVYALFEDSYGALWVGTESGLDLFRRSTGGFIHYRHHEEESSSLSHDQVMSICEDLNGQLWIGTNGGGLNRFDRQANRFTRFQKESGGEQAISSNEIYEVFCDSRNYLWIGSWHGHVDLYHLENNQIRPYGRYGEYIIRSIIEDRDGDIWICTHGDGLIQVHLDSTANFREIRYRYEKGKNSLSGNALFAIMEDQQGQLWIGTENEGLNIYDKHQQLFRHYRSDVFNKNSLSHHSVWSLYEDVTGNIWVGTYAGGINLFPRYGGGFQHYQYHPGNDKSLSHNSVTSFLEDAHGNTWIGTDGGGLNLFNPETETFRCFDTRNSQISSDAVLSIFEDRHGNFWVGTWGGGLNRFNRQTGASVQYTRENSGLGSNNVFSIIEDRRGRLWAGTFWGGVSMYDVSKQRFRTYSVKNSNLTDDQIKVICEDAYGQLWIGGDLGLNRLNPETEEIVAYQHDEDDSASISKGWVLTILETRDSTLWIGTTGGLNRFHRDTGTFTRFFVKDGLPNDAIKGMRQDDEGNLWLSTNRGLSKFNPETRLFKNYDVSDGLQGNEFYQCSHYKSSSGKIYFGGVNGFNVFRPSNLTQNAYVPPVVIRDFKIFNKPVPVGPDSPLKADIGQTSEIVLSHKQNFISFEFAALNYISPDKNRYAYRLSGSDFSDWNFVGTNRTATYTNLDPGKYRFQVKGSNNDDIWNEEGVALDITIRPPFQGTWGFRSLVFLALLGLLFTVYKWRVRSHHILRRRLETEVRERTVEVESQKKQAQASYDKLSETGKTVVFHSQLVSQVFVQIEKAMNEMNDGSISQNKFIQQTKEIVNSFLTTIRTVSYEAKKSAATAEKTVQAVQSGTDSMQTTLNYIINVEKNAQTSWDIMKGLKERSARIDEIVLLIDDIASRINILALNALIEAVKAGDYGQGFMVVAQEIRNLAKSTSVSVSGIAESIAGMQTDLLQIEQVTREGLEDVKESASLASEGRIVLNQISSAVNDEKERLQSIANQVNQMQEFSLQVQSAMDNVASVSQKNQDIVRTVRTSSTEVGFLIEDLSKLAQALKN